eukprot:m.135924 g.135924  ORF g.135924 m.135924 type:complete len:401 (-) comp14719_c0_seq3:2474-3676(-)
MDCDCEAYLGDRKKKLVPGRCQAGFYAYKVRLCDTCGEHIPRAVLEGKKTWDEFAKEAAKNGIILKLALCKEFMKTAINSTECKGFSLCKSIKPKIEKGTTFCGDQFCGTCLNSMWSMKACGCGRIIATRSKCCGKDKIIPKPVTKKENLKENYNAALVRLRKAASDIATMTGKVVQVNVPSWKKEAPPPPPPADDKMCVVPAQRDIDVYMMIPKDRRATRMILSAQGKLSRRLVPDDAEDKMKKRLKTSDSIPLGTMKGDAALCANLMAHYHSQAASETMSETSHMYESRYKVSWGKPKIFDMVFWEASDSTTALAEWNSAKEVRLDAASGAFKSREHFESEQAWEAAPWFDCKGRYKAFSIKCFILTSPSNLDLMNSGDLIIDKSNANRTKRINYKKK